MSTNKTSIIPPNTTLPKVLLFDWDNTLVESWKTIHQAMEATFMDYGLQPLSFRQIKQMVRMSARDSFPRYLPESEVENAIVVYRAHYQRLRQSISPMQGAESFLQGVQGLGIPCGVISNKTDDFLENEIDQLGWKHYFSLGWLGAGQALGDKPDPRMLDYFWKRHGRVVSVVSDQVYYIGDTGVDIDFARQTSMTAVLIGDNFQTGDAEPDHQFDELSALLVHLQSCSRQSASV